MDKQIGSAVSASNGRPQSGLETEFNPGFHQSPAPLNGDRRPLLADRRPDYVSPPPAEELAPSRPDTAKQGKFLVKLLFLLLVIILLVNVPLSFRGAGLAHIVPTSPQTVVRDGMLLKGSGPQIYVLDNYQLRPFDGPDTLTYFDRSYNYRLKGQIQIVEDDLLTQFGAGPRIYYLTQCQALPGVYALGDGQKRLVTALTLNPESRWDRVHTISCSILRKLPEGLSLNGERP